MVLVSGKDAVGVGGVNRLGYDVAEVEAVFGGREVERINLIGV